jgi:hypothetical protein
MNPNLIPPTPTLLPNVIAPVSIQASSYRIWKFTDEALTLWQMATPARTQVFQIAILVVILIIFVFLATKWVQSLGHEGDIQ